MTNEPLDVTNVGEHPAVDVAKARQDTVNLVTLSTGVRVRLVPVSASLVDEVTNRIKSPAVPMWHNDEKGRDEPNPGDPAYLRGVEEANHARGIAAIDAIIMFGVELVDGLPADDVWVKRLRYLGFLFNPDDPFEREFAYKKYVAVGTSDLAQLMSLSGVSQVGVNRQVEQFPGSPAR